MLRNDEAKYQGNYTVTGELLYWERRLTIPKNEELKTPVLESEHHSQVPGHFSIDMTKELV